MGMNPLLEHAAHFFDAASAAHLGESCGSDLVSGLRAFFVCYFMMSILDDESDPGNRC